MAVKVTVAGGIRHHCGVDIPDGFLHLFGDGFRRLIVRVVIEHGSDALGHRLRRDDDNLLLREGNALLRRHDNVLVVRQDKDRGGRGAVDLVENIVGGRIHRLAAGNDTVSPELPEELLHPLAGTDRYRAVLLFGSGNDVFPVFHGIQLFFHLFEVIGGACLPPGSNIVMLGAHVLDFCQLQRAVFL